MTKDIDALGLALFRSLTSATSNWLSVSLGLTGHRSLRLMVQAIFHSLYHAFIQSISQQLVYKDTM